MTNSSSAEAASLRTVSLPRATARTCTRCSPFLVCQSAWTIPRAGETSSAASKDTTSPSATAVSPTWAALQQQRNRTDPGAGLSGVLSPAMFYRGCLYSTTVSPTLAALQQPCNRTDPGCSADMSGVWSLAMFQLQRLLVVHSALTKPDAA